MITILLSLALCFAFTGFVSANNNEGKSVKVEVNPSVKYQKLEGWGSSLCWWAAQVGKWEESKVDSIVDMLVSEDELNMNIFRYNIGGGDDPSHLGGHMVKGKGKRAEMEGFKATENSPYDWNADRGQRILLQKIKEKRPDAVFEAFSNSAPYWMTVSGCAGGHKDPLKDNLKPEYYEAFCKYLIDVCLHFKDEYGIEFKTLEPFNESYSNYWYAEGTQEGCHFEPETQIKIIRILYPMLKSSGMNTVISASDETNLNHFLTVQSHYEKAGDIWEKVGQLNTHTYSGTNEEREAVRAVVERAGKPFWQSETGPSEGVDLESNLGLTQKMFNDLRIMRPQAWLDWQIMEEGNNEWCLLRGNFETEKFHKVKNYYVRKQVTGFIKQGYIFVDTDNAQTLSAVSPSGKELVIVYLNESDKGENVDLAIKAAASSDVSVWRTSEEEDCKSLPNMRIDNGSLSFTAPSKSLTTFVVKLK